MKRTTRHQIYHGFLISGGLGLVLGLGCATVEGPSGGPEDTTPPAVVGVYPDSGAVGLPAIQMISFTFSEKMEPVPAQSFLFLYPSVPVKKTKWRGRRQVEVQLEESLPPDTVIVVELKAGLADAHRVRSVTSRRYPLATAAAMPRGELVGQLLYQDKPLLNGVVELYALPPDTLEYFEQAILRRAQTDSLGIYRLPWLPVPGGPWLIRGFADANGDLRPGDNEAKRLLPGEFVLSDSVPRYQVSLCTLYDPSTPGRLIGRLDSLVSWPGRVLAWPMSITDVDTGWTAAPATVVVAGTQPVSRDTTTAIAGVTPGLNRLIFFVDADGDSLLSLLPAAGAEGGGYLEPHAVVDSLPVEPGLDAAFPPPRFPARLTWWPVAAADADTTGSELQAE
jgi:hypothetical protein